MRSKFLLLAMLVGSSTAFAGGFEKAVLWSGKNAPLAGANISAIMGSEAIMFNPAGLMPGKDNDLAFNISPTNSTFSGPVLADNTSLTSETSMTTPLALTYARKLNDSWAIGAGYFVVGGSTVKYGNVLGASEASTNIAITETGVGGSYKINDQWSVGLGYRMTTVNLKLKTPASATDQGEYSGSASNTASFRLGVNYNMGDWGLGFVYRTAAPVKIGATYTQTTASSGALVATGTGDMETQLPSAWTLGGHWKANENWMTYAAITMTNYAAIDKITVSNGAGAGAAAFGTAAQAGFVTKWQDQTNVRLSADYRGWGFPFRFGYIYTTAVTPSDYAKATYSSPGASHSLMLGSGWSFAEGWDLDGGLEYSMASGSGSTATTTFEGDFKSTAMAAHLGVTYGF